MTTDADGLDKLKTAIDYLPDKALPILEHAMQESVALIQDG